MAGSRKKLAPKSSAKGLRFACVVSLFNGDLTSRLLANTRTRLRELGAQGSTPAFEVPGAFELGLAAKELASSGAYDAVICLGAVLRGKTGHYDIVCKAAQEGVLRAGMDSGIPCVFGVLTCDTASQAAERSMGGPLDVGRNAADAGVLMALTMKRIKRGR